MSSHPENYSVIVVGAGGHAFREKIEPALNELGPAERRVYVDANFNKLQAAGLGNTLSGVINPHKAVVANANELPFSQEYLTNPDLVGIVATPRHLSEILALLDAGIRKLIVEKPLIADVNEAITLLTEKFKYRDREIFIYATDFYAQKLLPLLMLTGAVTPDDPRWQFVREQGTGDNLRPELCGRLFDLIGPLEGIQGTIVEGGDFGLKDLEERPYLEQDLKYGGMLLDLGIHLLVPLYLAGLIDRDRITVSTASRWVLGQDRRSFVEAQWNQPEIFANWLLSVHTNNGEKPFVGTVGKTFHSGGEWSLSLRGSKGRVTAGLRTGDHLTVQRKGKPDITLELKPEVQPYQLAFKEARAMFEGKMSPYNTMRAMIGSIVILNEIRRASS